MYHKSSVVYLGNNLLSFQVLVKQHENIVFPFISSFEYVDNGI